MDYLKECVTCLEKMNGDGLRISYSFLKPASENERASKETPVTRIEAINAADKAAEEANIKNSRQLSATISKEASSFDELRARMTGASDTYEKEAWSAWVNFANSVSDWLPGLTRHSKQHHYSIMEMIFIAGYQQGMIKGKATI